MTSSRISVFISSRIQDRLPTAEEWPGETVKDLRNAIHRRLQDETLLGEKLFRVIRSDMGEQPAPTADWREQCLRETRAANIVICLVNGHPGDRTPGDQVGICHAEFLEALRKCPDTLAAIRIPDGTWTGVRPTQREARQFVADVNGYLRGTPGSIDADSSEPSQEATIDLAVKQVRRIALSLIQGGLRRASSDGPHRGPALDWCRLTYSQRAEAMIAAMEDSLLERRGRHPTWPDATQAPLDMRPVICHIKTEKEHLVPPMKRNQPLAGQVLFVCHAIPDAMTIAAAREVVGQPFLRDTDFAALLPTNSGPGGPVHLIACHQGVTQVQAQKVLGYPDAVVVTAPFGVVLADPRQRVQMVFLKNCSDAAATGDRCRSFFEWLTASGETPDFLRRARTRADLVRLMASP